MKVTLALTALLALLSSSSVLGQVLSNSLTSGSNTARICSLTNCNLYANLNVCARYGRSNLCKRFTNACLMRYDACVNSVTYTAVSLSQCSGIATGQRRQCGGTSSLGSSSSANVIPIYISRG